MRPVAANLSLHGILSLGALAGYILLSLEPPTAHKSQRAFMLAGVGCAIASFIIVQVGERQAASSQAPLHAVADVLAVAVVALPLWLGNRMMQPFFAAAGAMAFMGNFLTQDGVMSASAWASVASFGLCGVTAAWTAYRFEHPHVAAAQKRPRIVTAYDIVRLTDAEKAERIAKLDARLAAGELEEHKYWDLRQEIEAR